MIIYIFIMLIGGLCTLVVGHPVVLLAAALVCGLLFTLAERNLRKPVVMHVREQLLARPECLHLWAPDPHRLELGAVLCTALARAKKWPNDRFIPDDPMEIAFFEVSGIDGELEVFEVGAALTKKTGGKIDWHELYAVANARTLTLSDLLEASLERKERGKQTPVQ